MAAAARQVEDVATALRQGNVPGHDVAAILAERALYAAPRRPLLIPNAEIAAYGLSHRPEVVGIEWPERETGPLTNRIRRGRTSPDVELLAAAAALEYWVAAHRRTAAWTRCGKNHAEAVALKVGDAFGRWCGDPAAWADVFWSHYRGLKHRPAFRFDRHDVRILAEGAFLLLTAELLDTIAESKTPSTQLFADHRYFNLREQTRGLTARGSVDTS